jgi:hypothetical protein
MKRALKMTSSDVVASAASLAADRLEGYFEPSRKAVHLP